MLNKSNPLTYMINVSINQKKNLLLAFASRAKVLTLFRMDLFELLTDGGRGKGPPSPWNLSHISYGDATWQSYTLSTKNPKTNKSCDTPFGIWWHQHFSTETINFCYIKKYCYRLHVDTNFLICLTCFSL